jgi:hypothetical protein
MLPNGGKMWYNSYSSLFTSLFNHRVKHGKDSEDRDSLFLKIRQDI